MKKQLIYSVLSLCLLSACNGDDLFTPNVTQKGNTIELSVTARDFVSDSNPSTRATDNGNTTTFKTGDRVGVIILDGSGNFLANNIPYVYNGTNWAFDTGNSESKSVYYYDSGLNNLTYIVYYPYSSEANGITSIASLKAKFAPKTDQRSKEDYRASDLMVWSVAKSSLKTLSAELKHAYACVSLLPQIKVTLASGQELNYASTRISDVSCTINGTLFLPYQLEDGSYRCIHPTDHSGDVRWFFSRYDKAYGSTLSLSGAVANTCYSSISHINAGTYGFAQAEVGDYYCADGGRGYLIPSEALSLPENTNCLGIVYWLGDVTNDDPWLKKYPQGCTHGLVVALRNAGVDLLWSVDYEDITNKWFGTGGISLRTTTRMQGYTNTDILIDYNASDRATGVNSDRKVLPIEAITTYAFANPAPTSSSGWYFPSVMELKYMSAGQDFLNTRLGKVQGAEYLWPGDYWSSSEYDYDSLLSGAWSVNFHSGSVSGYYKHLHSGYVRSILAF